jgi:hypothetical protein
MDWSKMIWSKMIWSKMIWSKMILSKNGFVKMDWFLNDLVEKKPLGSIVNPTLGS